MTMSNTIPENVIKQISTNDRQNERLSFQRRLSNLETFITESVNPIEEEILLLRERLIPLYDQVQTLREEAKEYCTHPVEHLVLTSETDSEYTVACKFCDTIFHVSK